MNPSGFPWFNIEEHKRKIAREDQFVMNHFFKPKAPKKTRKYFERDHAKHNQELYDDYFKVGSRYDDEFFRNRYRMEKHVFIRIVEALQDHDDYFTQRFDAAGKEGLSPLAKCTTAMRMIAYSMSADQIDEYIKIGGTTASDCLKKFCRGVITLFEGEYLRAPTQADIESILAVNEVRGFPGMIGSIDCMHWEWKNCPTAWHGQFHRGDKGKNTVILEAVATQDLWIWHAFFGCPGTLNDINVLDRSPVFDRLEQGDTPKVTFFVNGREYDTTYYLADGIYPNYPTFVKSIRLPRTEKDKLFAESQEACRKDIERAFGVLQGRFKIIREACRLFEMKDLAMIMRACIILHNMIVEDERGRYAQNWREFESGASGSSTEEQFETQVLPAIQNHVRNRAALRDNSAHKQLQKDLVEHIWAKKRN